MQRSRRMLGGRAVPVGSSDPDGPRDPASFRARRPADSLAGPAGPAPGAPVVHGSSLVPRRSPGESAVVVLGSALLWRRRRRWALSLPVIAAGAAGLQFLVKWTVERPRPDLGLWGFPSALVRPLS